MALNFNLISVENCAGKPIKFGPVYFFPLRIGIDNSHCERRVLAVCVGHQMTQRNKLLIVVVLADFDRSLDGA